MKRYCYISKILPGKTEAVRAYWAKKEVNKDVSAEHIAFWQAMQMTGFDCWLQKTAQGDFMIHCLEGNSLKGIFQGLREQIQARNPIALELRSFYLDVLGKDYLDPKSEPDIEMLFDVALPGSANCVKKGFFYPLLPNKIEQHRRFRLESTGNKRSRHEASMRAFGVSRLSTWEQRTPFGTFAVIYSERQQDLATASERLARGEKSAEWQEISKELMDHTGLSYEDLSPEVEWLTKPHQPTLKKV